MGLVDDLVRCCSDTRYFTERPRNLPLPIGSEGKLFDMFCFALTGYPRGMAGGLYTSPRFTIYTTFHSILFSSTNHLHSEGDNVHTYTNLYTPIRSATLAGSPFSFDYLPCTKIPLCPCRLSTWRHRIVRPIRKCFKRKSTLRHPAERESQTKTLTICFSKKKFVIAVL